MPTPAAPAPESTRNGDGKLVGRGAGNAPARGIMGSPPSDEAEGRDTPESKPSAGLTDAIAAFQGKPTRVKPPGAPATPPKGKAPQQRRQPPRPAKRAPAEEDTREPHRKRAPIRDRGPDDMPDGEENQGPEGPEDGPADTREAGAPTARGEDYSREAPADDQEQTGEENAAEGTDEQENPEPEAGEQRPPAKPAKDPLLQEFAQRFGLPLDTAAEARKTLVDDFAATLRGAGRPPASPAAGTSPGQQPQGHTGPASAAQNPPATTQQANGQTRQLSKEQVEALHTAYGEQFAPITETLQHILEALPRLQADNDAFRQGQAQRQQAETQRFVSDFFASKVKAGFRDRYGSQRDGLNDAQFTARQQLVQTAAAYQAGKAQINQFVSDADALEAAFQFAHRDQIQNAARQQGRREVGEKVQQRHRSLDVSAASGTTPARGQHTENSLSRTIRGFLGTNRR